MLDALELTAAALASYLGFALLAVAMPRHRDQVAGVRPAVGKAAAGGALARRALGGALLLACLALSLHASGPGFGTLLWVCLLSLGGFAVVATLAWRPALLRPLA